jgi:hypothetical protein
MRFLDEVQAELWERAKALERDRALASRLEREGRIPTRQILLGRNARHLAVDIELVDEIRTRLVALRAPATKESTPATAPERKTARGAKQRSR